MGNRDQRLPEAFYVRCEHGMLRYFERCRPCDDREAAEALAEKRKVDEPAQRILDSIEARRPWYRRCGFCHHSAETTHDDGCHWSAWLQARGFLIGEHVKGGG